VDTTLVPSLELTYGEEDRVERKIADTSERKKSKNSNNPTMKEIQQLRNIKDDRKAPRHGEKAKKRALDTKGLWAQGLKTDGIDSKNVKIKN